jgi:hypothetical protein
MTAQILTTTRELDSRVSDAIHVRMLWHEHDGRVTVAVADSKTGDAFAVEVREGDRAMEVFHHPYAYADRRRAATATAERAAEPVRRLAA